MHHNDPNLDLTTILLPSVREPPSPLDDSSDRGKGRSRSGKRFGTRTKRFSHAILPALRNPLNVGSGTIRRCALILLSLVFFLSCAGRSPAIRQGLQFEHSGDYEKALDIYTQAMERGEGPHDRLARRRDSVAHILALRKVDEGRRALNQGHIPAAVDAAGKALELDPHGEEVHGYIERLRDAVIKESNAMLRDGQAIDALGMLDLLTPLLSDDPLLKKARSECLKQAKVSVEEAVEMWTKAGMPGNALVIAAALAEKDPQGEGAHLYAHVQDELKSAFLVPVRVKVSSQSRKARRMAEKLQLLKLDNPCLTTAALNGQGEEDSPPMDLIVNRVKGEIVQTVAPAMRSRAVPGGTKKVPNPAIKKIEDELSAIKEEVMRLGDELDRVQEELSQTRNAMERSRLDAELQRLERIHHRTSERYVEKQKQKERLPPEVDVIAYKDIDYPVRVYTRRAEVSFMVRVRSERPDLRLNVELPLRAEASAGVDVHPAIAKYGIPEGKLVFEKSDDALMEEALDGAVSAIGHATDSLVHDYLLLKRGAAEKSFANGEIDEAVEGFTQILMCSDIPLTPTMAEAFRARGLKNPDLLSMHR